jgi:hypothetical protein
VEALALLIRDTPDLRRRVLLLEPIASAEVEALAREGGLDVSLAEAVAAARALGVVVVESSDGEG